MFKKGILELLLKKKLLKEDENTGSYFINAVSALKKQWIAGDHSLDKTIDNLLL